MPNEIMRMLVCACVAASCVAGLLTVEAAEPRQASGVKVGEVTESSAIVWTRITREAKRRSKGVAIPESPKGAAKSKRYTESPDEFEGACPGAPGRVRVRYSPREDLADAQATDWASVSAATDFTQHFRLNDLRPDTVYFYAVETTGPEGTPAHAPLRGKFETAPPATRPGNFRFCVMTCQGFPDRGHIDGHPIYPSMLALSPRFVSFTGDVVYYDNDPPRAYTPALARLHWQRMFSLPREFELLRNVAGYWLKDDHDTLSDDSWPGRTQGELTFAEGQRIFREQTPLVVDGPAYRTFRWGRDLQIWLTDGRDDRSPNNTPDGPEKTIWGQAQKDWFFRTVKASDATWKLLISPTPLVGPDREAKNDNHANSGFRHEGDEIRAWLQTHVPDNLFVACGDRHWQYHSVHPQTGLHEFSVGPASDEHAGGTPGEDPGYHRFHRVRGGFLSVALKRVGSRSTILFEHRDVQGDVVYSWSRSAEVE